MALVELRGKCTQAQRQRKRNDPRSMRVSDGAPVRCAPAAIYQRAMRSGQAPFMVLRPRTSAPTSLRILKKPQCSTFVDGYSDAKGNSCMDVLRKERNRSRGALHHLNICPFNTCIGVKDSLQRERIRCRILMLLHYITVDSLPLLATLGLPFSLYCIRLNDSMPLVSS